MILDLDEAKAHLHMTHDEDDDQIVQCILAAEAYAAQFMERELEPWDADDTNAVVPDDVRQAIKMLVGEYYESRTQGVVGTIYAKLPHVESILHFHRKNLGV